MLRGATRTAILLAALTTLTASSVQAATYLLDFGGSGTNPSTGGTWNVIKAPSGTSGDTSILGTFALVDSTGSGAANVQLQFTDDMFDNHGSQANTNLTPQVSPLPGGGAWVDNNVLLDYLILAASTTTNPNPTGAFKFNNLTNGVHYSLEIVGSRETTSTGRDLTVSANGLFPDNFPTGFMSQERNKTIAAWADLTPVSGSITVNVSVPAGSTYSYVNGMRLVAVPEPATAGVVVGTLVFLGVRRRSL